jgi:hypothetical protein
MKKFKVTFLFHPACDWNHPINKEEIFEAETLDAAWDEFQSVWHRNTTNEKIKEIKETT